MELNRYIAVVFSIVIFICYSCGVTKHLVYIDDWAGNYKLIEKNSCCDITTEIRLDVLKNSNNDYSWKLFFENGISKDTLAGRAVYSDNKLKFFSDKPELTGEYFGRKLNSDNLIFWMEYDNYYSDNFHDYIGYYTRWNYELKGYRSHHGLGSGIDFHFQMPGKDKILRPKN